MNKPKPNIHGSILGLVSFELDFFKDARGQNFEIFNYRSPHAIYNFKLDSCSRSTFGVLRGFHGDNGNYKLIQCLYGEIQLYLIDMREKSTTYGNVKEFILNARTPKQVLIPAGVVNAHLCLSADCVFYYKWSDGYVDPKDQLHVKWNDERFRDRVKWRIANPLLSDRDK